MRKIIRKILRENLQLELINEITSDEAWEKIYSDTTKFPVLNGSKQIFDKIDALYPKKGDQFNKGYFTFLYNLLKNKQLKEEDFYKVKQYLELFDKNLKQISKEKRDINQYKTLPDLYDVVADFENQGEQPQSKSQELKNIREKELERVYEDEQWKVLIPKTERASCLIGKGTQWCTAADKSVNRFNYYNKMGDLYVLINKNDDSKYQIHFEDGQLMDAKNREVSSVHFFEYIVEDNALVNWFQEHRDDFYDFILETSAEDVAGGGYSELFHEALSSASQEAIDKALDTLRNGESEDAIADGFLYEKDASNIKDWQITQYVENFNDSEMFPRVIEHLTEIGVDFDEIQDGNIRKLLNAFDELKKHKLEVDTDYKIDKRRKLRILSVDMEGDYPRYRIKINDKQGLVPLDTLLTYLHNRSLFENQIKLTLRNLLYNR